jgi:hypothetical protein
MVQDVRWLQSITSLPILVKGVMSALDGKENNYKQGAHPPCFNEN